MQSKYYKSSVEPAIDSAIRVGLEQLMETVENQVYDTVGSSTSYYETRDELQNLQCVVENYAIIHKGASLETIIGDVVKTVVYKALGLDGDENSSWVSPDELEKRNPNKFRKVLDEDVKLRNEMTEFELWKEDNTIITYGDGNPIYSTQDALYRNKIKGDKALYDYFINEFRS